MRQYAPRGVGDGYGGAYLQVEEGFLQTRHDEQDSVSVVGYVMEKRYLLVRDVGC
jgi:hypothetical protein